MAGLYICVSRDTAWLLFYRTLVLFSGAVWSGQEDELGLCTVLKEAVHRTPSHLLQKLDSVWLDFVHEANGCRKKGWSWSWDCWMLTWSTGFCPVLFQSSFMMWRKLNYLNRQVIIRCSLFLGANQKPWACVCTVAADHWKLCFERYYI